MEKKYLKEILAELLSQTRKVKSERKEKYLLIITYIYIYKKKDLFYEKIKKRWRWNQISAAYINLVSRTL